MRPLFLLCASLLAAAPASGEITLPPQAMSAVQIAALEKSDALVRSMEAGMPRHRAATFLVYRLLLRGDCSRALPIMNRELKNVSDFPAIGGLVAGALAARDPRCLTWVADRTRAVLQSEPFSEEQRAELRVNGRTMYQLAGWFGRAANMPAADLDTLDVVPDSLRHRTLRLSGLTVEIEMSDMPTRLETLLMDRLFFFRGTPLQLRLARALAERAPAEPGSLSGTGWMEVALTLLEAGDEDGAERVLAVTGTTSITLAGLRAEAALRRGDYPAAAAIFGASDWPTRSNSASGVIREKPEALASVMDRLFAPGTAQGELAAYAEKLDAAGFPELALKAAAASLKLHDATTPDDASRAQLLARTGDIAAARALLAEAVERSSESEAAARRLGIAIGAGAAGDVAEVERILDEAPAEQVDEILIKTLLAVSGATSPVRAMLEKRLELRLDQDARFIVSSEALLIYARGGLSPRLATRFLERHRPGKASATLALRAANTALWTRHRDTALAVADASERLIPDGPEGDPERVELAHIYWKLGCAEQATAVAMRVSNSVGQVDALSRGLTPARVETRKKWSFELF